MTKLTRKERRIIGRQKRKLQRILKRQGVLAYMRAAFSWQAPAYRSYDEQRRLYERWRAGRNLPVIPLDDYHSKHEMGTALDLDGWRQDPHYDLGGSLQ